jgi:outer membrane protein OmpA-like peptidoglycan-associated protein
MRLTRIVAALVGIVLWSVSLSFAQSSPAGTPSSNAAAVAAPEPQGGTSTGSDEAPLARVAATSGGLGLFTLETGQLLPKGGWTVSAFANKFSRMPGSVTVLQYGLDAGVGVTNWLNVSILFNPYEHMHVNAPGQLSFLTPLTNQQFPGTIYRVMSGTNRPAYVEDFPFASHNGGGVGPVTLGLKVRIVSQAQGAPFNIALRNDIIIPTRRSLANVLQNEVQTGQINDRVALMVSRNWSNFVFTTNVGWQFTIDPEFDTGSGEIKALNQAQQLLLGGGFIVFPQKRIQLMSEYNGVIFVGPATPNNSFGSRDPVEGIWGLRLYPLREISVDAGYRYMLNLSNHSDRHGFVIKVGMGSIPSNPVPPPPANRSPVAACSLDNNSVFAGTNDILTVNTTGTDPDNDPLNYSWTATGGRVEGTGAQVRWLSAGVMPGRYTITVTVDDGRGGTTMCSVEAAVAVRPNRPPTVSLNSDRDTVFVGERVHFTATAADPDNDPLTYTWRTNGGELMAANTMGDLNTTGVAPGSYTVTVRVEDGRGGAADASKAVTVQAPPPPPQSSRINGCDFMPASSARVDNVCKRILDDVALRLQNEPRSNVVIVGFADPGARADRLAASRGENVAQYLAGKGVDRSRVTTRTGSGQAGAGQQNRRIDIIWVPEGATY